MARPKEYKKKADLTSRAGKYYLAKVSGKNKKDSAIEAGLNPTHTSEIEASKTYQAIERRYRDVLLDKIGLDVIAEMHADNITQTGATTIDRGARNKAIEMAVSKIEPEESTGDEDEKLIVVLRG